MTETKKHCVLFVDDEPRVTLALKAIFRRDYKVLTANSGVDALQILRKNKVDVVVSDQRMPNMLGNELLAKISRHYPQTMRILLTGFMDKQAIVDSINDGEIFRFINKPWDNQEMRDLVAEAAKASQIPALHSVTDQDNSGNKSSHSPNAETSNQEVTFKLSDMALLMMEKKQDVRHQIRKFCSDKEIMIYGTQNVNQAIAAATSREAIGVAIIELTEDTRTSVQTINLLKQARPELITIALTEEYDAETAVDLINQGQIFKYLAKPLETSAFQKAIQNAFKRHVYLKQNKKAIQRFQVEKPSEKIVDSLQSFFGRFLST